MTAVRWLRRCGERAARSLDVALAAATVASYVAMVAIGAAQVFFRFVLQSPLSWSEELIRYVFVWSVFLTAAVAFQRDVHVRVELMTARYPGPVRVAAWRLGWLCVLAGLALIALLGTQLVFTPAVAEQRSAALGIPMWIPYASIPVGAVLMLVNASRTAWRTRNGDPLPRDAAEVP